MTLHISDHLKLPESILHQHIAVLGKTGSGKSSAMRTIVEIILAREERVCIIDPKGDWWGLKSSASGKSAGYPVVIFGGEKGDVPINRYSGGDIAELVAGGNRPCIIDLGGWMPGDRTHFFIDFASKLFRALTAPLFLVMDEVHNFVPQGKVMDVDSGKMLHWGRRLASEGRGKGLSILAASQRPQKVDKDFLTCSETLIAMRVIHNLDRDAVKAWLDGAGDKELGKKIIDTIASMERGEAWIWSPEAKVGPLRAKFPMFKTYDSFAAPTGGGRIELKGWAEVDLEEVKAKLAAVVQEAEANDPDKLHGRIAELEQELETARTAPVENTAQIETVHRAIEDAVGHAIVERDRQWQTLIRSQRQDMRMQLGKLSDELSLMGMVDDASQLPDRPVRLLGTSMATPASVQLANRRQTADDNGTIGKGGKRRIMIALAQNPNGLSDSQLAALTDLGKTGGTMRTYLTDLRAPGYIDGDRGSLRITPAGLKALGSYQKLPTGAALRDYWRGQLGTSGKRRIFDALVEVYPRTLTKEQIGDVTGIAPEAGTMRTYLTDLRALQLIEGRADALKACKILFDR